MNDCINILKNKLSRDIWVDERIEIEKYLIEPRGRFKGNSNLLLKPRTTEEVSKIVKICNAYNLPLVPQGGRTGLTGGSMPSRKGNEVIISLERMNKIISVDPDNYLMTVQSGCILSEIKKVSEEKHCFFPLKLASEGSCTIGGNISTNAGGLSVLKYGMTRDLVAGIEVVLPNGDIINNLKALKKDNRAYDVKHLFIGAEGTLGIITSATIKLFPQIKEKALAIVALRNVKNAIKFLSEINSEYQENLTTFELISHLGFNLIEKHFSKINIPFKNAHPWYVILELTSSKKDFLNKKLNSILEKALEAKTILDAIKPININQKNDIWSTRELLSEAQKMEGLSIKHDISVPIDRIPDFLSKTEKLLSNFINKKYILVFGHLADGNLHYNVGKPEKLNQNEFKKMYARINNLVFSLVQKLGGSFSAEHGIGKIKIKELEKYSSKQELSLKRSIKLMIDPKKIMNPGKIFK